MPTHVPYPRLPRPPCGCVAQAHDPQHLVQMRFMRLRPRKQKIYLTTLPTRSWCSSSSSVDRRLQRESMSLLPIDVPNKALVFHTLARKAHAGGMCPKGQRGRGQGGTAGDVNSASQVDGAGSQTVQDGASKIWTGLQHQARGRNPDQVCSASERVQMAFP